MRMKNMTGKIRILDRKTVLRELILKVLQSMRKTMKMMKELELQQ